MKTQITRLIANYQMLIENCDAEHATGNLEIYIKGKRAAYERIIEDLKQLDHYAETT